MCVLPIRAVEAVTEQEVALEEGILPPLGCFHLPCGGVGGEALEGEGIGGVTA